MPSGCWVWTGGQHGGGYGGFVIDGRKQLAHRIAYELVRGTIPDGLCVCHHCDNRGCVRPSHLFLGTKRENTRDMLRKGRARKPCGEAHFRTTLTADQVRSIRRAITDGEQTSLLASRFGVSRSTIRNIIQRRVWKSA